MIKNIVLSAQRNRARWLAIIIAGLFVVGKGSAHWSRGLISDENAYFDGAIDIAKNGLISKWIYGDLRTYMVPSIIASIRLLMPFLKTDGVRAAFIILQFASYAAVCWFVATKEKIFSVTLFSVLLLNIWNLVYVAQILTETFSIVFILLSFVLMRDDLIHNLISYRRALLIGLAVGAAIMTRSANIFLLAPCALVLALRIIKRSEPIGRTLLFAIMVIASTAAMTLPQLINNIKFYDRPTPLLAKSLGSAQLSWGIKVIKYATRFEGGTGVPEFYRNPFANDEDIQRPFLNMTWYSAHPIEGVATIAIKVFNLFDQDLPLPYNSNMNPWYRFPLSVLNHIFLFMGFLGTWWTWRNVNRTPLETQTLLLSMFFVLPCIGLYAMTALEGRFGLPLLTLFSFFIPVAVNSFFRSPNVRAKIALFIYLVTALCLSEFVHRQITENMKLEL